MIILKKLLFILLFLMLFVQCLSIECSFNCMCKNYFDNNTLHQWTCGNFCDCSIK